MKQQLTNKAFTLIELLVVISVIGILTTFYDFNRAYSLASVVYDQLVMNVRHGYKTVLFVHDNFKDDDKVPGGVEIRKVVPRFLLVDYSAHQDVSPDLDRQAEEAYQSLLGECRCTEY